MHQVTSASTCIALAGHTEPESSFRLRASSLLKVGSRFDLAGGAASAFWGASIRKSGATDLQAWFSGANLGWAIWWLILVVVIVASIVRALLLIRSYWRTAHGTDRVEVRFPL